MKPQIFFIHGAASTPLSFNWLKGNLKPHNAIDIAYENQTPLIDTIDHLRKKVSECNVPPIIIGHSLGGIIAASIAQEVSVKKIVTMSTPFGGSFAASLVRWFMPSQLIKDVCQQSPVLLSLQKNPPKIPMLSFVTDSNLIMLGERTDGVVTVASQMALNGPNYIKVDVNHFEILMYPLVIDEINNFIFLTK